MIPNHLQPLFWDVNLDGFTPGDYPEYTISRILELGDEQAVKWMKQTFPEGDIKRVIATDPALSRKSANFWASIYGIAPDDVAALRLRTASVPAKM
jgi:hypothetical protein